MIRTRRAQVLLIEELLQEEYTHVLTARLQSDSIERRFSQYRQVNGGNFLVNLKKVTDSEKMLLCRTLLKEDINFFADKSLKTTPNPEVMDDLTVALALKSSEIQKTTLTPESNEVSLAVAGYVAKMSYFAHLFRGGLTVP